MSKFQGGTNLARRLPNTRGSSRPFQELSRNGLLRTIWSIEGLAVADLGCGVGDSTRLLRSRGVPRQLVGFDSSRPKLALARQVGKKDRLGVNYCYADYSKGLEGFKQNFDLAVAMGLLHHAQHEAMLAGFARTVFEALRYGGRFFTIVLDKFNPHESSREFGEWREWIDTPGVEGSRQSVTLLDRDGNETCETVAYYWSRETYSSHLQTAGFSDVTWTDLTFNEKSRERYPEWQRIEATANCSLLTARRA